MSCTINSAIQSVLKENSFYDFKPSENFIHITKDLYSKNNVSMSKHNIAVSLAKHLNKEFKAQIVDVGDMFFPTNSNDSTQGVKVQYTKKQAELVDQKSEENEAYNEAEYHRRKNQMEGQYTVIDGNVVPFTKPLYSLNTDIPANSVINTELEKKFNTTGYVPSTLSKKIKANEILDMNDSNYLYSILNSSTLKLLQDEGVTINNFNQKFNEQINSEYKSSWFDKLIEFIKNLLMKNEIKKIKDNIEFQNIDDSFTEHGNMELFGITNSQVTKIPQVNEILFNSIIPFGYTNSIKKLILRGGYVLYKGQNYEDFLKFYSISKEITIDEAREYIPIEKYNKRLDAWRLSNGLPQLHDTFVYKGRGVVDKDYNFIADEYGKDVYDFKENSFKENNIKYATTSVDVDNMVMGNYAINIGRDNIGMYFEYTDLWDLEVGNKIINKVIKATQSPFIINGKLYKALEFDQDGNSTAYHTTDVSDPGIKVYNEQLEYVDMMPITEEDIDQTPNCN